MFKNSELQVTSSHSHLAIIVDFISPGRNKFEWEENK
jgi:hypothetical protein